MPISSEDRERLFAAARAAIPRAYAPYSQFRVGAAVLAESGAIYPGCNLENISYGLTNCAERAAIATAVAAEGPKLRIRAVAVFTNPITPCSPCGACRQVILEFGPQAAVFYNGPAGVKEITIRELLPDAFASLPEA